MVKTREHLPALSIISAEILHFLKGTGRKLPILCVFTYCIYSFHHNIHWCSHSLLFRSQCILLHWNKTLLLLLCNHYLKAFIFRTRYPFKFKGDSICFWLMENLFMALLTFIHFNFAEVEPPAVMHLVQFTDNISVRNNLWHYLRWKQILYFSPVRWIFVICETVSIPAGPWFGQGDPVLARMLPRDWESRIQGI